MRVIPPVTITQSGSFTRGSSGSYIDSRGYLADASANTPRYDFNPEDLTQAPVLLVEPTATNYLLQSEQFNTTWTLTAATISNNVDAGPNNLTTADKLVATSATSLHYVQQSVTVPAAGIHTFSVFLKAAEENTAKVTLAQSASSIEVPVDLTLGTLGTIVTTGSGITFPTATIKKYMNGWYRVSITGTTTYTALTTSVTLRTASYTGDNIKGIYVFGGQLEASAIATSYIKTLTLTVIRSADAYTGTGLIYSNTSEAGGINLLSYTEQFEKSAWIATNCNITTNAADAPTFYYKTAESLAKSGASGTFGHIYQKAYVGAGQNVGKSYTASIWLWADLPGIEVATIKISDIGYNTYTSTNIVISDVPTRYTFTSNGGGAWNAAGTYIAFGLDLTGAAGTVYAFGAQLEANASVSAYVSNYSGEVPWVTGIDYPVNTIVTRPSLHKTYLRLSTGSSAGFTLDSPPESGDVVRWVENGPDNRWAMFTLERNTATISPDMIQVIIRPGSRIDSIALTGLVADSVTITAHDNNLGTLYNMTNKLVLRNTATWSEYFFGAFSDTKPSMVKFDLPPISNATISVTILRRGGVAECSALVVGTSIDLGSTQVQPVSESLNFSKIDRDTYGTSILIPRRTVSKTSQTLFISKEQVNSIRAARTSLNAVPAIWSGLDDDYTHGYFETLLILGVYKEFTINLEYNDYAKVNIQLEEI